MGTEAGGFMSAPGIERVNMCIELPTPPASTVVGHGPEGSISASRGQVLGHLSTGNNDLGTDDGKQLRDKHAGANEALRQTGHTVAEAQNVVTPVISRMSLDDLIERMDRQDYLGRITEHHIK